MPRRSPRGCSLYIRPVPDDCRYGFVQEVTIPVDYRSGRMKGFAFVEFDDIRDGEDALRAMDRSRFMGRTIEVQMSRGFKKSKYFSNYTIAPSEMQQRDRYGDSRRRRRSDSYRRRRSYSRSRSKDRKYSRSPPPNERRRSFSRERSGSYRSRSYRSYSR